MTQATLAELLRVLRARQGLTVAEAAARMGIQRHTLRDLELGRRTPTIPTLHKIAEGYAIPVEELLGEPALSAGKAEAPSPPEAVSEEEERRVEPKLDPREGDPLSLEWAYRADLDLFRASLKDRESAELRELGANLSSEFFRVRTRDELQQADPVQTLRRVRAFMLAGIVNEELASRGEEPLRALLLAFRRFEDAMADAPGAASDDEVAGGAEAG